MGALALAELNAGSQSPGWGILQDIATEPTPEGRLAAALRGDREPTPPVRRPAAPAWPDAGTGAASASDDELALLREIINRVVSRHVRGDKATRKRMIQKRRPRHAPLPRPPLDPSSAASSSREFYFDLNPEYGGIGAFVNFDSDDVFSIVRPIYSGPAYEANLRSGDKILAVDGWETSGHTSDQIIKRLKGKPGTPVKIKVFRRGWDEPRDFVIKRRKIQVPSVNHELLPGKVGYVEIVTFGGATSEELASAADRPQAPRRDRAGPRPAQQHRRLPADRQGGGRAVRQGPQAGGLHQGPRRPAPGLPHRGPRDLPGYAARRDHQTATRRPPPRSPPAPCRTTAAPPSSASAATARAACRRCCRCWPSAPRSTRTSTATSSGTSGSPTPTPTRTGSTTSARGSS